MQIKLLALDMDGTTYYRGGTIIPTNIKPIQEALKLGIEVVIVTGRPPLASQNQLVENGFVNQKALMAAHNGACLYDFNHHKVVKSSPINGQDAKILFDLVETKYHEVELWGYVDDLVTVVDSRRDDHTAGFRFEKNFFDGQILSYQEVKDHFEFKFFKLLAFNASPEFISDAKKLNLQIAYNFDDLSAEINASGVNKAFAIKWIAKEMKITCDQIMAIGDGANDLPMIEYATYGVAMKNSIEAIKKVAKIYIDQTNEEGAVGTAINTYLLKK